MAGAVGIARQSAAYITGGVYAGLVLACLDLFGVWESLPEGAGSPLVSLVFAIHVSLGVVFGTLAALAAWTVFGSFTSLREVFGGYVFPPPERQHQFAAEVLVGSTALLCAGFLSWLIAVRCFAFNHVRLAAAVLVIALYVTHFIGFRLSKRLILG